MFSINNSTSVSNIVAVPRRVQAADKIRLRGELRRERLGLLVKCLRQVVAGSVVAESLVFVPEEVRLGVEPTQIAALGVSLRFSVACSYFNLRLFVWVVLAGAGITILDIERVRRIDGGCVDCARRTKLRTFGSQIGIERGESCQGGGHETESGSENKFMHYEC